MVPVCLSFLFFLALLTTGPLVNAQSCRACNCRFNNIEGLTHLIEERINHVLADEPRSYACMHMHVSMYTLLRVDQLTITAIVFNLYVYKFNMVYYSSL